jgi:glycosyltransferase involved in cell wall biosynthesis
LRIAIASDAWVPQVNGVVRTLRNTVDRLRSRGYPVMTVTPDLFATVACPGYREIRLAIAPRRKVAGLLRDFAPDIVHIATEGPIGWTVRRWCLKNEIPFTTAFHTRFPDYASVRTKVPADWFWPLMRRFHAPSGAVLAATPRLARELEERGLRRVRLWSRGVDLDLFDADRPADPALDHLPRPLLLSVGRISLEKNLDAFLSVNAPGTKIIVGDGPMLNELRMRYPSALFLGARQGEALAAIYRAADVFVFPSRTDTFGLVMIEALASGVPVAGYRVPGPLDIIGPNGRGASDELLHPVGAVADDLTTGTAASTSFWPLWRPRCASGMLRRRERH